MTSIQPVIPSWIVGLITNGTYGMAPLHGEVVEDSHTLNKTQEAGIKASEEIVEMRTKPLPECRGQALRKQYMEGHRLVRRR